ncbi:acyl-CoA dehydrogenase family protein [Lonsdalea populi]|uniref:acyl-CoA dehydrogenase family protein n=1 Tax=Lonsdalea populi TaxID=1172565 RepID=UPI000A22CEA0|nr:acyl-CoA dehydrogenase [Lonsdalea populi]OSM94724.1 acyl-CoA dehydrogenase [Lonsdalea populi]RAT71813.1 acyl-CoA dehydrogenase [Lonsdalea populi]RAT71979.1 acyl-CoA dehydrogenase [Lonsdalea populi]RAT75749.1 acyl-CoA dehydrogenase [Lonsdalea populi]RAT79512.1 acyl-CoA dehydrogenase [Lonsdalea populi]
MSNVFSHDKAMLTLPFYQPEHIKQIAALDSWCQQQQFAQQKNDATPAAQGKHLLRLLGQAGWLANLDGLQQHPRADARSACLFRQTLAYHHDLLDFAWSIQTLSGSVIRRYGNDAQRQHYLPRLASGEYAGAFALSEPEAGSDVSAVALSALRDGDHYLLSGEKAWIAQGDIADCLIVIARTGEGPGPLGLSAFIVDATLAGISSSPLDALAPRSWAHLHFDRVRIPAENLLSKPGQGFIIALDILDRFRMTVASAAIGFARRAADIALRHASRRKIYQGRLIDLQLVKAALAKMEITLSAATLMTAHAAWQLDQGKAGFGKSSAMAKHFSTEQACRIVDDALQILGAAGVVADSQIARLYRQIRPLRIYEGASDALLMNIASALDSHHLQQREDLQ